MRTVGLKLLKNKLSEYVRAAAAGETIQVADRNKIVAELRPVTPERAVSYEQFCAKAVREGRLRPATLHGAAALPPRRPLASFDDIMKELDQDREDR
jgi:antitoxin (DNA-binding transcriptional repressor) of toxin-antitoxin stability system